MIASDILPDSSALVNDSGGLTWNNAVLFPYLKLAYDELVKHYQDAGVSFLSEVSTVVDVAAGIKSITSITDLILAKKLEERADGSTGLYTPMTETDWELGIDLTEELRFWNFREGEIKLVGATSAREVRVYYMKTLSSLSTVSSTVAIPDGKLFLVYRTAALAAGLSGGNGDRALELNREAQFFKDTLINIQVKGSQGLPVRHKRYRS